LLSGIFLEHLCIPTSVYVSAYTRFCACFSPPCIFIRILQRILTGASSCRRSGVPKTVAIADQTPKGCLLSITETERGQRVSSARQIFTSSATASDYDKQRKIFAIKIDSLAPNMMHLSRRLAGWGRRLLLQSLHTHVLPRN
jgi:uncharacterized protein YqkB